MDSNTFSYAPVIIEEKIVAPHGEVDAFVVEKEVRPLPSYPEIEVPQRSFSPEVISVSYQNQYPHTPMNSFPQKGQATQQNSFYYYQSSSQKPISVSGDDETCCIRLKMACTMVFAIVFVIIFLFVSLFLSGGMVLSAGVLNANPFWVDYTITEQSIGQNSYNYYIPSGTYDAQYIRVDLPKSSASTSYNTFSLCYTSLNRLPYSVLAINSYLPFLDDQSYDNGLALAVPYCGNGYLYFQICEYSAPHVWVKLQDLSSGFNYDYFNLQTSFRTNYSEYCDYTPLDYSRFTLFIATIVAICLSVLLCCFCSTCCCCFCRYQNKLLKYHQNYAPIH